MVRRRAKAHVNLESYEAMMQATRKGQALIVPGEPDKSRLLHTLEGKAKQMPPRKYAYQPTAEEASLLREWTAAGAKKDSDAGGKSGEKPTPPSGGQFRLEDRR
jgi:hypothetical protein